MKIAPRFVHRLLRVLLSLWLPVLLIAIWWFASANSTSNFYPPLSTILSRLRELWLFDHTRSDLLPSLENLVLGYAIATVLGISIAALLWRFKLLALALEPLIYFLFALPSPALLPAVIIILGIGVSMKVFIIAFACLWPILLNSYDGMRGTDTVKLDVAATLRLSTLGKLRRVVLPAASPQIVAGMRTSLAVGIILMVISEFSASTKGIGYFIFFAQQTFATTDLWTGILVLAVVGSLINFLFVRIERLVLSWHFKSRVALTAL
jgi:sulfonate transport system permease protein